MFRNALAAAMIVLALAACSTPLSAMKAPFIDISDEEITLLVKGKLAQTQALQSLQVYTVDGRVILVGQVSTSEERKLAEDIALKTKSVRQVRNQIIAQPHK